MATAVHSSLPATTPHETGQELRLAAIDVGSNSLHMVIAQVDADGGATNLWRVKEMVGLGRISFPSHRLSDEAIDRALAALKRFGGIAVRRQCEKVVAVATSAVREAENGGDFIERARQEAGVHIRVVSAKEEAHLIYLGVRHAVDLSGGPHLIVDIGGGSVELIVADNKHATLLESRKLGAARMTAKFIHGDLPKRREVEALLRHFEEELDPLLARIRRMRPVRVFGTSGTLENLAAMCGKADHPASIALEALDRLVEKLLKSTAEERVEIRGMDEKRQDQITAGALLVQFLMNRLRLKRITLCDSALREGILLEYIGRHLPDLAIRRQVPDPRRRSVLDLARKCDWHEAHSLHVTALALKMFDQLRPLHELDDKARELIEYAAMLHDIGWHIGARGHHKHSMYLVRSANLQGFAPREVEIIANITRYHRKSMPKSAHEFYVALSREDRRIVDVGGALLRLADGLDRSHSRAVGDLHCTIRKREVEVKVVGRGDVELELWAARRKTDLFGRTFGRKITFEAATS